MFIGENDKKEILSAKVLNNLSHSSFTLLVWSEYYFCSKSVFRVCLLSFPALGSSSRQNQPK